jgi:hypothetical protein
MFAVAVRDGGDLFLSIRMRRSIDGDIYYVLPTGRRGPEWKQWNPHGSLHKDGNFHHKSFDRKISPKKVDKPDANFKGTMNMISVGVSSGDPRAFGVKCDCSEFSEVMEVPVSLLSPKKYETYISVDLTERDGGPSINTADGKILAQHRFDDSIPEILVSVVFKPIP